MLIFLALFCSFFKTLEVNANPTYCTDCLESTKITGITGSCTQETKDALMATKQH